jgi:hypothetical protein
MLEQPCNKPDNINIVVTRGVGTGGGGHGAHVPPPPNFFKGLKVPFFVMKSALYVHANVAANTKLTSERCPFCLEISSMFLKKIGQKRAISVW